jgi:tRNA pseudouridine synthase 10
MPAKKVVKKAANMSRKSAASADFEKKMKKPAMIKTVKAIVKGRKICANCLGRQFGMVSTGMTNQERGNIIFNMLHAKRSVSCDVCGNVFKKLPKIADEIVKRLEKVEFKTFVVGTRLSDEIVMKEEGLWESADAKCVEPIRSEINRELGKLVEKKTGKRFDDKNPDVTILFSLKYMEADISIRSLYVYGRYNKLVRGLPQTKWEMYKETVEDLIAKPFMEATDGKGHAMHATGREDIDAKCLAWRPFVLEINQPKKRKINLNSIAAAVNKSGKVAVKDLRLSDKKEVVELKTVTPDKTYRVLVEFEKPVKNIELVKKAICVVSQRTPKRVAHRRADKVRKRTVKNIKWKRINDKKYELEITGEAGLYIKELVSGDGGRTKPSVSELLGNSAVVKELDVIKIHMANKSRSGKAGR